VDNGYWLWSFQGRILQKQPLERFCQLQWRPRPASLLTAEHIKVKEELYTKSFITELYTKSFITELYTKSFITELYTKSFITWQ